MNFSIITASFKQLDLLRLCVASVKDQIASGGGMMADADPQSAIRNPPSTIPALRVEHIIQDAGTPGIEEFAREIGADFHRDGKLVFQSEGRSQESGSGGRGGKEFRMEDTGRREGKDDLRRSEGAQQHEPGQPSEASPPESRIPNPESSYRIAVFCESDKGMYDAINKGLLRATGEICAYLNCDEQYLPGALGHVAAFFEASAQTDVLFGAAIVVRPDGTYLCDRKVSVPGRLHTLVSGNLSVFTSSTFFRKGSVVDRSLLFDPTWRVVGDGVWILRLLQADLEMRAVSAPLSSFAFSGDNLSFQQSAAAERHRLQMMAPWYARVGKPVILGAYRAKRLLSGSYSLKPHRYRIYTAASPGVRKEFDVEAPTFRWNIA